MDLLAETILTCCWSPIIWKDNIRKATNFEFSDFMVLDFDEPGEESMSQVNKVLSDHKRLIATTKNHLKEKNGIICERYRLIVPWEKRITDFRVYQHNYKQVLKRFPWADKNCADGARFFYPCENVVYLDRNSEYMWEICEAIPELPVTSVTAVTDGKIPRWCLNFLNNGAIYNGSRNLKIYSVALELFKLGFDEKKVRNIILKAPIKWDGVNLEAILKSARSKK